MADTAPTFSIVLVSVYQRCFHGVLLEAGITISMDGCGRWLDNISVELSWIRGLLYPTPGNSSHRVVSAGDSRSRRMRHGWPRPSAR